MSKIIALTLLALALCLGATACKSEATPAEKKAQRQREFRARQKKLAIECYQNLVTQYPDSEFAPQAQQRLQELGPAALQKK